MQTALIALTLFGCTDSLQQCTYIATLDKGFETVAACDKATDRALKDYSNQPYPSIIALCEAPKPEVAATAPTMPKAPEVTPPAPAPREEGFAGFAARASALVRASLPSRADLQTALVTPVHVVSDGYSWAVRRLKP